MSLNELKSVAHYIMRIDSGFAIRDSRIKNLKPTITGYQNTHAMKKHSGMRPQDIVILLKIAIKGEESWSMKDLSQELEISASEVSESHNRSSIAGLLFQNKKQLMRQALMDFFAIWSSVCLSTATWRIGERSAYSACCATAE